MQQSARIAELEAEVARLTKNALDAHARTQTALGKAIDNATELDKARAEVARLRGFAVAVRDSCDCDCDPEEYDGTGPHDCECGGDECWRCAAEQALAPPPWAQQRADEARRDG